MSCVKCGTNYPTRLDLCTKLSLLLWWMSGTGYIPPITSFPTDSAYDKNKNKKQAPYMPLSTFKGLPENTEGLKKIALWEIPSSLHSPDTHQRFLCAGLGNSEEQYRCGPVLTDLPVWWYLNSRVILGLSFMLLLGLGALPAIWLHSLVCHQRIWRIREERKAGRNLKSEQ